jgi:hypothetical protein
MINLSRKAAQAPDIAVGVVKTIRGWAALWIAAIFLAIMAISTRQAPRKHLPEELLGEWHTSDPSYADRTFELDSVCIAFGTGPGMVSVGLIKDVKEIPEGNHTLYTVSYVVDDSPNEVSFYYDPKSGLWFKNQEKIVWRKRRDN